MEDRELHASTGVRIADVATALALAADLSLGQPLDHVLRSCAIAMRFAERLGMPEEDRTTTYWVALLIMPGCTAVSFELARFFGDDIAFRAAAYLVGPSSIEQLRYALGSAGAGATPGRKARLRAELIRTRMRPLEEAVGAHCSINVRLAESLGVGERVARALGQSFARWDGKGIPRVKGEEIALPVRIAGLADVVEVANRERGVEAAVEQTETWSGIGFDPALVRAWSEVAAEILAEVEGDAARDIVLSAPANRSLTDEELRRALELLADHADLKSPWFLGHSRGVASLTGEAARRLGLPAGDVRTAEHAALVHGIGRSGVPNSIWDAPRSLTDDEWERVRLHAYHTDRVLRRAGGLARLAPVASAAHERVNGTGYPRGIGGETIPLLGRILGCADAYHAMREDRPHRAARSKDAAAAELRRMGREGELDGDAVDAVLAAAGHPVRRRPSAPAGLTPREIEVLDLAARGSTTRQIARRLGISPKTAGNHIERIYVKIGVSSRAEAALFAMQNGLLRDLEP